MAACFAGLASLAKVRWSRKNCRGEPTRPQTFPLPLQVREGMACLSYSASIRLIQNRSTFPLGTSPRGNRPVLPHIRFSGRRMRYQPLLQSFGYSFHSQSHRAVVDMDFGTRICCSWRVVPGGETARRLASVFPIHAQA